MAADPTPIPIDQPSKDQVLALINRDNERTFTFSQIQLGTPQPFSGARNTVCVLSAVPGSGFFGDWTFYYNRRDLAEIWSQFPAAVVGEDVTDTLVLIDLINVTYNMMLEEEDIIVEAVTSETHTLRAHPDSLAFIGEVQVEIIGPTTDLSTTIHEQSLEGLFETDGSDPAP